MACQCLCRAAQAPCKEEALLGFGEPKTAHSPQEEGREWVSLYIYRMMPVNPFQGPSCLHFGTTLFHRCCCSPSPRWEVTIQRPPSLSSPLAAGEITTTSLLDREAKSEYILIVRAVDGGVGHHQKTGIAMVSAGWPRDLPQDSLVPLVLPTAHAECLPGVCRSGNEALHPGQPRTAAPLDLLVLCTSISARDRGSRSVFLQQHGSLCQCLLRKCLVGEPAGALSCA